MISKQKKGERCLRGKVGAFWLRCNATRKTFGSKGSNKREKKRGNQNEKKTCIGKVQQLKGPNGVTPCLTKSRKNARQGCATQGGKKKSHSGVVVKEVEAR